MVTNGSKIMQAIHIPIMRISALDSLIPRTDLILVFSMSTQIYKIETLVWWMHVKVMWCSEFLEAFKLSQIIKQARLPNNSRPHRAFFIRHKGSPAQPIGKLENLKFISPDLPYKILKIA